MSGTRPKSKQGQMRILEAVVAAMILFIVFSGITFLIQASNSQAIQEKGDLDRFGYNVLSQIVENRVIEGTLDIGENPHVYLTGLLQRLLPSSTHFKLTISKFTPNEPWGQFNIEVVATNTADSTAFEVALEVSSIQMLYTSENGHIYNLVLSLARAGGA